MRARFRGSRRALIATVSMAVVLVMGASVAFAAGASEQPEVEWSDERHCATELMPVGSGDERGEIVTAPVEIGCFPSLAEAIEAGSAGAVLLPESTAPAALTDELLEESSQGVAELSSYLLGTEWDSTGFGGSSNSYFAPGDCVGSTWTVNYVGTTWNDRFESGKGFSSCDHNRKFEHADFDGALLLCTPNCSNYGVLRNEVSSLKWKD